MWYPPSIIIARSQNGPMPLACTLQKEKILPAHPSPLQSSHSPYPVYAILPFVVVTRKKNRHVTGSQRKGNMFESSMMPRIHHEGDDCRYHHRSVAIFPSKCSRGSQPSRSQYLHSVHPLLVVRRICFSCDHHHGGSDSRWRSYDNSQHPCKVTLATIIVTCIYLVSDVSSPLHCVAILLQ
jgi:hypothetical protein